MWMSIPEDILYEVIDDESFEEYVWNHCYSFNELSSNTEDPICKSLLIHLALEYYLKDNILDFKYDKNTQRYDVLTEEV